MEAKINSNPQIDVSEIVEKLVNKPKTGTQLSVLTSPILLNELCDVILPGLDFPIL